MDPNCNLFDYHERDVRITTVEGEIFDGFCTCDSDEFNLVERGWGEDSLEIDHWVFYRNQIREVRYSKPDDIPLWMGSPLHRMHLQPEPYRQIEEGTKIYEIRLYDEKRRKVNLGDVIRFENTADDDDVLFARVEELRVFDSFEELYRTLPLRECGYTAETVATASPKDMERYFSPEEQQRYGVVGIRIAVL